MSKLTKQDFYCGAGLAILFRKNEHISPSFIESVVDVEGRNSSGIFYKFKTPKGNEAIIYVKCFSKIIEVKNLSLCWEFSLSSTEKEKINKQISKNIPFFILLICVNDVNRDDINGEAALLTIDDYKRISNRTTIRIGLWTENNNKKVERQKVFVVKNDNGNGMSRDYYFDIKRNQVEKVSLDDLISEYYPSYKQIETEVNEIVEEEIQSQNQKEKLEIYVAENPKHCMECNADCTYRLVEYLRSDGHIGKINTAICPTCGKKQITRNFYHSFMKSRKSANIDFIIAETKLKEDANIYLIDDNSLGCKKCDSELSTICYPLNIHRDITASNDCVEKIEKENLFYCEKCKMLFANNVVKCQLLKKYGRNKIKFKHYHGE